MDVSTVLPYPGSNIVHELALAKKKAGHAPVFFYARFVHGGLEPRAAGLEERPKVSSCSSNERRAPSLAQR